MTDFPASNHDIFTFPEEGFEETSTATDYMAASTRDLYPVPEEPSREGSSKSSHCTHLSPHLEALSHLVDGCTSYRDAVKRAGDIVLATTTDKDGCIVSKDAANIDIMLLENIERQLNLILMAKIEGDMGVIRNRAVEQAGKGDGEEKQSGSELEREVLVGLMRVLDEPL